MEGKEFRGRSLRMGMQERLEQRLESGDALEIGDCVERGWRMLGDLRIGKR